jgi:hypothetical protein
MADAPKKTHVHMDITGYVARVDHHFERLGVDSRPTYEAYVEAWNTQMPARKMAETFARRLRKGSNSEPSDR